MTGVPGGSAASEAGRFGYRERRESRSRDWILRRIASGLSVESDIVLTGLRGAPAADA